MEVWESTYGWNVKEEISGGRSGGVGVEPKIMGHCASTVHTIKHRPGAESLCNYSPINAGGMIAVRAKDKYAKPSSVGEEGRTGGN